MKKVEGNSITVNKDKRIAIIASKFNKQIVERLIKGAVEGLKASGFDDSRIDLIYVPGAYEIPLCFKALCLSVKNYSGIITLGCVIKGDTAHFEYVAGPVAHNLNLLSSEYKMPHGFGVLTVYDARQAFERSGDNPPDKENNKGYEAAVVMLEMMDLMEKL
ncbi:MAG: 6,7-dimethyl-8-ribityllumazine synthase [Ignavibacteria bacterium]|nr:6,7-dimethyl-8-ribityllumazine synthase [Ignavibacteria bacterium]